MHGKYRGRDALLILAILTIIAMLAHATLVSAMPLSHFFPAPG